jgi:hypothetical protein
MDPASSRVEKIRIHTFLTTRLRFPSLLARFFSGNIISDEPWKWVSTHLQVSQAHVKLFKFMLLTYILIFIIRQYVREDKAMEIDDEWRHGERTESVDVSALTPAPPPRAPRRVDGILFPPQPPGCDVVLYCRKALR